MDELRCRFLWLVVDDGAGDGTGDAETGDVSGSVAGRNSFTGGASKRGGVGPFWVFLILLEKEKAWKFEVVWLVV